MPIIGDICIYMLIIIPLILYYIIIKLSDNILLYILVLISLWFFFISSNPYSLSMNNKYEILKYIPKKYIPKMSLLSNIDIIKIKYPVIFKPTICTRRGGGVELINNINDAQKYITKYGIKDIMIQQYINTKYEVGILYERNPLKKDGTIISIVERANYNSIVRNNDIYDIKYKNRNEWITPMICKKIDEISKNIPNFYVGRYDIKFDTIDNFLKGHFNILEVNGIMGFDLARTYPDNHMPVRIILNLLNTLRWFSIRILYGFLNIIFNKSYSIKDIPFLLCTVIKNTIHCNDWEKLFAYYT